MGGAEEKLGTFKKKKNQARDRKKGGAETGGGRWLIRFQKGGGDLGVTAKLKGGGLNLSGEI